MTALQRLLNQPPQLYAVRSLKQILQHAHVHVCTHHVPPCGPVSPIETLMVQLSVSALT